MHEHARQGRKLLANGRARAQATTQPFPIPLKCKGRQLHGTKSLPSTISYIREECSPQEVHIWIPWANADLAPLVYNLKQGKLIKGVTIATPHLHRKNIVRQNLRKLQLRYPHLLQDSAINLCDNILPPRAEDITLAQMRELVAKHGPIDIVGGNWHTETRRSFSGLQGENDYRILPFFAVLSWLH